MNRIKVYDTHTEIINGLFIDIEDKKDSIAKDNLKETLKETLDFKARRAGMNSPSNREVTLFISEEGMRQFNIAMQEQMYTQLTNMRAKWTTSTMHSRPELNLTISTPTRST